MDSQPIAWLPCNLTIALNLTTVPNSSRLVAVIKKRNFTGKIAVPGDKSITHRALIFSALTRGMSTITGPSPAEDCRSTAACLSLIGLEVKREQSGDSIVLNVKSDGLGALRQASQVLDAGNSGTTIRLMAGLVAGRNFSTSFDGDGSLRKRPMRRVLDHLKTMGATVSYEQADGCAPFTVTGAELIGCQFSLEVASAQVQTAILLAGLQAQGHTSVRLPAAVRDHTERMFRHIGVPFDRPDDLTISVARLAEPLPPAAFDVPADISSAAFFMVGAACMPGSDLLLSGVGLNPGRTLILDVLKRMGANITASNERICCGEPVADIRVRYSQRLCGTQVTAGDIARGIDEIPILALAGAFCEGSLIVTGAAELRHKESDRLSAIVENLNAAGAEIEEYEDGFRVIGAKEIQGGSAWHTYLDHRLAMTGLIASVLCREPVSIEETASSRISYPAFEADLARLTQ